MLVTFYFLTFLKAFLRLYSYFCYSLVIDFVCWYATTPPTHPPSLLVPLPIPSPPPSFFPCPLPSPSLSPCLPLFFLLLLLLPPPPPPPPPQRQRAPAPEPLQCRGDARSGRSGPLFRLRGAKIRLIGCPRMEDVSDIKLKRPDTTLELRQKAEKR